MPGEGNPWHLGACSCFNSFHQCPTVRQTSAAWWGWKQKSLQVLAAAELGTEVLMLLGEVFCVQSHIAGSVCNISETSPYVHMEICASGLNKLKEREKEEQSFLSVLVHPLGWS